jgi:tripeptide aminopeptidase
MYQTNNLKEVLTRTVITDFSINRKLLDSIMYQQSPTYDLKSQGKKAKFLLDLFKKHTGAIGTLDKTENIYFTKGESEFYPTIVAHYDTAQEYHPGLNIQTAGDWIYGFDVTIGLQCGIGADDSIGVYFALEMMKRLPVCKVVLFFGEERGCIGSSSCDMKFFKDSLLVSQLDRRSFKNDFIVHTNGVTVFPENHLSAIQDILDKYNYQKAHGSCTDVGALRKSGLTVASHNTACGYFNEHTDEEIIHIPSMINAMAMVYEIQSRLLEQKLQLEFPPEPVKESNWTWDRNYSYFDDSLYPQIDTKSDDEIMDVIYSEWNFFKEEINDELIYDVTGVHRKEVTEENCSLDPDFFGLPYVMYHKKSYSSIRGQFMDIRKADIKHLLLTNGDSNRLGVHSCCTTSMIYNIELDHMYCPHCLSQYYYEFEPDDLLTLPEDSNNSLSRTVQSFV